MNKPKVGYTLYALFMLFLTGILFFTPFAEPFTESFGWSRLTSGMIGLALVGGVTGLGTYLTYHKDLRYLGRGILVLTGILLLMAGGLFLID